MTLAIAVVLLVSLMGCSSDKKTEGGSATEADTQAQDKAVQKALQEASKGYDAKISALNKKLGELINASSGTTEVEKLPTFVASYIDQLEKLDIESAKLQQLLEDECKATSSIDPAEANTIAAQITANIALLTQMKAGVESHRSENPAVVEKIVKDIDSLRRYFEWLQSLPCLNSGSVVEVSAPTAPCPKSRISGKVVDDKGKALPDATVILSEMGATLSTTFITTANGEFITTDEVLWEQFTVTVTHASQTAPLVKSYVRCDLKAPIPITVSPQAEKICAPSAITGKVMDGRGNAVEGVELTITGGDVAAGGEVVKTNADGAFTSKPYAKKDFSIKATHKDFETVNVSVNRCQDPSSVAIKMKESDPLPSFSDAKKMALKIPCRAASLQFVIDEYPKYKSNKDRITFSRIKDAGDDQIGADEKALSSAVIRPNGTSEVKLLGSGKSRLSPGLYAMVVETDVGKKNEGVVLDGYFEVESCTSASQRVDNALLIIKRLDEDTPSDQEKLSLKMEKALPPVTVSTGKHGMTEVIIPGYKEPPPPTGPKKSGPESWQPGNQLPCSTRATFSIKEKISSGGYQMVSNTNVTLKSGATVVTLTTNNSGTTGPVNLRNFTTSVTLSVDGTKNSRTFVYPTCNGWSNDEADVEVKF